MIVIEPIGGLGNRLRAIDSSVGLAHEQSRALRIVWHVNPLMGARYEDLLEPIDEVGCRVESIGRDPVGLLRTWLQFPLLRRLHRAYGDDDHFFLKRDGPDFRGVGGKLLHYHTCQPFFVNRDAYRWLRPIRPIREAIATHVRPRQVGIHIRRTDNKLAIELSPLPVFVSLMEKEVADDPAVTFFVASDDPAVESALRERFGSRMRTHPKRSLDRRTREAACDALVDMGVLASCQKIIGSHFSSFSEVAANIGGIPLEIALRDPHGAPAV